jgi:pectate lyase
MQRTTSNRVRSLVASLVAASLGSAACLAEEEAPGDFDTASQELVFALQGESQAWTTSSGDSIAASSSNARLQADASGDSFSFSSSVTSGTYSVVVRYAKRNVYGNYRVEVNGTQVGTLSGYTTDTSDVWNLATFGSANISGTATIRFVSTGKDAASTDYDIKVDYIELRSGSTAPPPTSTGTTPPPPTSTATTPPPPPPPSGSASCTIPSAKGQQSVSSTIKVSGTLDGGLKRYVGSGSLGSGTQSESQGPLFELAAGATLRNVIIGSPAADGVHCKGTCTLENVYWEDVGEDAATQKGSSSSQVMTINGGVARSASDKVFQHNGPGTMNIRNFCVENFGKLYRSCGNCSTQYKRMVNLDNVIAKNGKGIAGINTNYGDVARFTRITVTGSPVICEKYRGVTSGEPTKIGSGADGVNCIYSSSDIIKQ